MTSQATGDLATTVAENIRNARQAKGLTQRQLADAVGTDPGVVSKWERGKHTPGYPTLALLGVALEREVAWFYENHGPRNWAGDDALPDGSHGLAGGDEPMAVAA